MSHLHWSERCKWFDDWDSSVLTKESKLWVIRVSYNKNSMIAPESLENFIIFTLIFKGACFFNYFFINHYFYYSLLISSTITFLKSFLFKLKNEIIILIYLKVFSILFNSKEYCRNVNKTKLFCFIRFVIFFNDSCIIYYKIIILYSIWFLMIVNLNCFINRFIKLRILSSFEVSV